MGVHELFESTKTSPENKTAQGRGERGAFGKGEEREKREKKGRRFLLAALGINSSEPVRIGGEEGGKGVSCAFTDGERTSALGRRKKRKEEVRQFQECIYSAIKSDRPGRGKEDDPSYIFPDWKSDPDPFYQGGKKGTLS